MPLQKQNVPISFAAGIDTKTDKKQLQGKMLSLQNAIFQTGMELRKRNGFALLPSLSKGVGIAAYNSELISLDGSSLYSYDVHDQTEVNKGSLPTTSLNVSSIIRNNTNQTIPDSSINGTLQAFCWYDSVGQLGYSIIDTVTGQSIVNNKQLSSTGTKAKVLSLGSNFVFIYYDTGRLRYKTVPVASPTSLGAPVTIASDIDATKQSFDATVFNNQIYLAYGSTTANTTKMYYLTSSLVLSSPLSVTTSGIPDCLSVVGDASNNAWVGYGIIGASGPAYYFIANSTLTSTVLASTLIQIPSAQGVRNITMTISGTTATFYYEVLNTNPATLLTPNYINTNTGTLTGTVGTPATLKRGAGLASKAFVYGGTTYFLVAFNSPLQSTYFLINQSGQVVLKMSPDLGGGYTTTSILPEVNVASSNSFLVASLIKDLLIASGGSLSTQTGVQSGTITFTSTAPSKIVLGDNLHFAGGILEMYDGANVVEHGYNVYPEGETASFAMTNGNLGPGASASNTNQYQYCALYEWTDNQGQSHRSAPSIPVTMSIPPSVTPIVFTGTVTAGTNSITNVSSTTGLQVGQYLGMMYFQRIFSPPSVATMPMTTGTTIVAISGTTISLSTTIGTFPSGVTSPQTVTIVASTYPFNLFVDEDYGLSAGSTSFQYIQVSAAGQNSNPVAGQAIFGIGKNIAALPSGTYITNVNLGTQTITISTPSTGETGDNSNALGQLLPWFIIQDTGSATITVPTLKLTQKSNVSIAIYRTALNGKIFYRVTSLTSPLANNPSVDSVTFTDTVSDSTLIGNEELYTTGGVVENIEVPAVSVMTTFKSRAIAIPSENQLSWWYSKQVIPGIPVEFSDVFVNNIDSRIGSITAAYAMDDKLVFFGPTSIFYVVGDGPTASGLQNTFTDAQLITSDVGCTNQASVVLMPLGLMFQSSKGIYLLDRSLQVQYIGADVEAYNSITITSAQLMNSVNQVRFTLSGGGLLVYDYFYKQWDYFTTLNANDSCMFQKQMTMIQPDGSIYQENRGSFVDNATFVNLSMQSNWMSFANIQGFQRVYSFLLLGEYKSPHTLTINIYTDFNDASPSQSVVIPVLSDPGKYQYRVFLTNQKTEAIKIEIIESQTQAGEGLSISNMAFIVGVKQGAFKVPASVSYS